MHKHIEWELKGEQMEQSMYIFHEVHTPLIIFICAQQPHVHEEPGEDNKDGSQSNYWSHYWE